MKILLEKCPDIKEYMQVTQTVNISSDVTLIFMYKRLFRSDNVILDIYKNEILNENKIISSKVLQPECIIVYPNNDLDFNYYIYCIDIDGINRPITYNNLNKYYLHFVTYDGKDFI